MVYYWMLIVNIVVLDGILLSDEVIWLSWLLISEILNSMADWTDVGSLWLRRSIVRVEM